MTIGYAATVYMNINDVDLSDHVTEAKLDAGAEMIDITALGTDVGRVYNAGLKTNALNVTFQQDYAAAEVDATLSPLLGAAAFAIIFRPTSGVIGAANPEWTGNWVLESYDPVGNRAGELMTATAVFKPAGAISRDTS